MCDVEFLLGRTWPRCEAREEPRTEPGDVHPSGDAGGLLSGGRWSVVMSFMSVDAKSTGSR